MTPESFVRAVEAHVGIPAVESVVENLVNPPGRVPRPEDRELSAWYAGLSELDRERIISLIGKGAHAAIFGVLAVLDGVRTVDDEASTFELVHVSTKRTLLNPPAICLHEELRSEFLPGRSR